MSSSPLTCKASLGTSDRSTEASVKQGKTSDADAFRSCEGVSGGRVAALRNSKIVHAHAQTVRILGSQVLELSATFDSCSDRHRNGR